MQGQQPQFQTESQFGRQGDSQQWSGQPSGGQAMEQQSRGRLPPQARGALTNVAQAIEVCGWCADQCIQEANPHMIECIRLCEDVVELGEATLALTPRNSRFSQSVAGTFQRAVQACAQECSSHPHAHCQECAQILSQVGNATQQLVQPSGQPQMQ